MKLDIYECDRCHTKIEVESDRKPITVEHIDGRFMNDEKQTLHLCDDCYSTFLYSMNPKKEQREAFDELAEKFAKAEEET